MRVAYLNKASKGWIDEVYVIKAIEIHPRLIPYML